MNDLPPYSGADTTCPKCGGEMVTTTYLASADEAPFLWRREFDGLDYPLMRRCCACCGYAWAEAPLDATPPMNGDTNTMIDTQTQPEKQINLLAEYLQARWPDNANDDAVYVAMRLLDRMREAETPQRFAAPMLDAIPDDDASGQIEQLANYLLDKWSAHIRCGGAAENAIAILDQYATPAAADHDDDEPEDAYLAAKLAAHTPPDARKPASTARKAETGISYPGDRYHTVESNLERLTACAQETPSGIGADSEPSIPVSRIVAVLAERHAYHERETRQSTQMTHLGRRWECDSIAETLGIEDDYRAELARRRKAE